VYRILLTGGCLVEVLGCPFYGKHINSGFVREICKIQADLPLEQGHLDKVISLLRLSPSALGTALHPMQLIIGRAPRRGVHADIDRCDRDIFLQALSDSFKSDFFNPVLREHYHEHHRIREVETHSEVTVKTDTGIILEYNSTERVGIGRAAEDLGGGIVRILLLNSVPEPWEPLWKGPHAAIDNPEQSKMAADA
jgi:hypothetical protein